MSIPWIGSTSFTWALSLVVVALLLEHISFELNFVFKGDKALFIRSLSEGLMEI